MTTETIATNNVDKQLDGIFNLPVDAQRSMFSTLLKTNKELQDEKKKLQTEVVKRDKAIEIFATAAIDIRQLHPLNEIADVLNMSADELTLLKMTNPREYLKTIMRHFTTLRNEKLRQFKDMQVDPDGKSIFDKLDQIVAFFEKNNYIEKMNGDTIKLYSNKCEELIAQYRRLNDWVVLDADLINFNEAVAHGVLYYAIDEMKKTTVDEAAAIAYNPATKLAEMNPALAKTITDNDESSDDEDETPLKLAPVQTTIQVDPIEKPVGIFEQLTNAIGLGEKKNETIEEIVPPKNEKSSKKK